jgi:hypothetical protein
MAFPQITACVVCELIRPEARGKYMLLGYFGVVPNVALSVDNMAAPVQLGFVFAAGKGNGKFKLTLRMTSPNGDLIKSTLTDTIEGELFEAKPGANIYFNFSGVLPKAGLYNVALLVDGVESFKGSFGVNPAQVLPSSH